RRAGAVLVDDAVAVVVETVVADLFDQTAIVDRVLAGCGCARAAVTVDDDVGVAVEWSRVGEHGERCVDEAAASVDRRPALVVASTSDGQGRHEEPLPAEFHARTILKPKAWPT